MFDYAIGQNRRHPPSRLFFASWFVSCVAHACAVLILIQYPQLLRGGINRWFRPPSFSGQPEGRSSTRLVTVVSTAMEMPPLEVLRRYAYNWSKPPDKTPETPPIRVNVHTTGPPPEPKPAAVPPAIVPAAPGKGTQSANLPGNVDPALLKPPPEPKKAEPVNPPVTNPDQPPGHIPKGLPDPKPPVAAPTTPPARDTAAAKRPAAKAEPDEQRGARLQGSTLFDTKGFPMQEYIELVEERVKENWFIPSNLRDSRGSTTIVFYIRKDGRTMDVHIDHSSGNTSLDLAALSAVMGSNPFPPLPSGFPADRVGARFVFAYNERQ
jgi:protein TonB